MIILVGNKSDLDDDRQVSYTEAYNLARKYNTIYVEVSAKTGYNVFNIFEELTKLMIKREDEDNCKGKYKMDNKNYTNMKSSIILEKDLKGKKQEACCN